MREAAMKRSLWIVLLLAVLVALLPSKAWALRCGTHIVKQGDLAPQVREIQLQEGRITDIEALH